MADEQTTTPPDPSNTTPAPAPQAASTITPDIQAMIDAAKREAYNAGAATTRRALEASLKAKESTAAAPPPAAPSPAPAVDVTSQIARLRTFDRALGRFDLTDGARDMIEADFNLANPADPASWLQARSEAYGWKRLGAATTTPATPPPPAAAPAPQPAPPMPGSTPPAAPVLTNDTPLLTIARTDSTQVDRIAGEIGPAKFKERLLAEFRRNGTRVRVR